MQNAEGTPCAAGKSTPQINRPGGGRDSSTDKNHDSVACGGGPQGPEIEANGKTEESLCHGEKREESSHTKEDMEVFLGLTSQTESNPNICETFMFNFPPNIGFFLCTGTVLELYLAVLEPSL